MAIPESQLDTWSHQGSITQSKETYASVKSCLESTSTPYYGRSTKIFLQGSYGNDTNIYRESDVDVVIRCDDTFHHDLSGLSDGEKTAFRAAHSDATYPYSQFRADVLATLRKQYGSDVSNGEKAITIAASGNRRKSDVIAAMQFRRYSKFSSASDENYSEGICFWTTSGTQVINYPRQHSENLTSKHQRTSSWLKPSIRILKNLRNKLVADNQIPAGLAPSYYLEGLLYNVPDSQFGSTYARTLANSLDWLNHADRSQFVCANEQYYLLNATSPVTWRDAECSRFQVAALTLWAKW